MKLFAAGQSGFTLVEMMTVISIMAVLSMIVIVSTRTGNERQQLRDAASNYVSAARNAESLANGAQAVGPSGAESSRKAYGVCLTSSEISSPKCDDPFAAGKTPDTYQVYARDTTETQVSTKDVLDELPANPHIVATFRLPKDFVFDQPDVHIDYVPPAPTLYANGLQSDLNVIIRQKDVTNCAGSQDCQTIKIKPRAGAIYVES